MVVVRDLLAVKVDGDVYENIADCIGINYETDGTTLTAEGVQHFYEILDIPVLAIKDDMIIIDTERHVHERMIDIDGYSFEDGDMPRCITLLVEFFEALAGYVSVTNDKKWFNRSGVIRSKIVMSMVNQT